VHVAERVTDGASTATKGVLLSVALPEISQLVDCEGALHVSAETRKWPNSAIFSLTAAAIDAPT
jgi:hypothetical protein